MSNPWFKFYAGDYLSEVKLKGVGAGHRSCFITALCYASQNHGRINTRYMTSDQLKIESGVKLGGTEWEEAGNVYDWLVGREFGDMDGHDFVFKNWSSRQTLSAYERVKKHRAKMKNDNADDNKLITTEENREEESRIEKKREYLTSLPEQDLKELTLKYEASTTQVKRKGEELRNYCLAKGKTYKNYRAFLENALQKDFGRRIQTAPKEKEPEVHLDADAQARVDKIKREISSKFKVHAHDKSHS